MAAGQDNSSNLGYGIPTMSVHENWSGAVLQSFLGSHFKKHLFCPFWPLIKWKVHFYVECQKTIFTKVVGLGKMHISTKNGAKIRKFARELAHTMVTWLESQVNSCLVAFFIKSFPLKHWHAMFGIFF
jgi:hypothetical protein